MIREVSRGLMVLCELYSGWDGCQTSFLNAVEPCNPGQLAWLVKTGLCSLGKLTSHIVFGRVSRFSGMPAPGRFELLQETMGFGSEAAPSAEKEEIVRWLDESQRLVGDTLNHWTVLDLALTCHHDYGG